LFRILFIIFLTVSNAFSQTKSIISILDAGNCNSVMMYDDFTDTLCKKYGFKHLYLIKDVRREELLEFSEKLFSKRIDTSQIVSEQLSKKLHIDQIQSFSVAIIIDEKIVKVLPFDKISDLALLNALDFNNAGAPLVAKKNIIKDSITLSNRKKYRLSKRIRLSESSSIVKRGSSMYILDPLFREEVYKINLSDTAFLLTQKIKPLINYDSLHYYYYKHLIPQNKRLYDTIIALYRSDISQAPYRLIMHQIYYYESYIYLLGAVELFTYVEGKFESGNHNLVIKLDSNLHFVNYYFDPKFEYNGYFPFFVGRSSVRNNDATVYALAVKARNEVISVKKNMIYKYDENNHHLVAVNKDTLVIPISLSGKFSSNVISSFFNLNDFEQPVWFVDPFLYLYYPMDSVYLDLLNDTLIKALPAIAYTSNNLGPFYNSVVKTGSVVHLVGDYLNFSFSFSVDISNKKVIQKQKYPLLSKFKIRLICDSDGNRVFIPLNSGPSNDLIYYD